MKKLIIVIAIFVGLSVGTYAQDITPPEVVMAGFFHSILLSYTEEMSDDVLNKEHYEMFNSSLMLVDIVGIRRVDTSSVIMTVPILPYKVNYVIRVTGVHDISGNLINENKNSGWVYFEGFSLDEPKPYLIVE